MLFQVVLALESLSAGLARERNVIFMSALVDHQIVGLGESSLAIFAHKFALGPHFAPKLATLVRLNGHYGEHGRG